MDDVRRPLFLRPSPLYRFILLAGLIWLAFGLRLGNLDAFGFWTDESLTPLRASYAIPQILRNEIILQGVTTQDTHPPLFYLITHFTRQWFGETDFAYRFPAVLWGILLVPLMYQFGRRLRGRQLGGIAALLTAVNPLLIWYANEARMYPQVIWLMAAASYALWRAYQPQKLSPSQLRRCLLLYLLAAAAAVYTHYAAVFVIAVQSLFWGVILWRHGRQKWIMAAVFTAILAAIPLLPYTLPRLLAGAEANYFPVSPWIMLQDVVHGFNLGLTVDFQRPAIKLLDVGAFILIAWGFYAAGKWRTRLFLLAYLLAAVFGLMIGSALFKPMYQGVRHIIVGSPAFYLLAAWGIAGRPEQSRIIPVLGLLIMLGGAAVSLTNLYANPDYAKDDFRGLIQFIERNAGANDVVVYNNAVHLPMHAHYQQRDDLPADASPIYPQMAAAAPPQLAQLAQSYDRIWFVTDPPTDKRDPDHLAQRWLDEHLTRLFSYNGYGRTAEIKVIAYDARPQPAQPPADSRPLDIRWDGLPPLTGWRADFSQPARLPALWFDLYWQSPLPAAADWRVSLQSADGRDWGEGTHFVSAGRRTSLRLPLPYGLPPGSYSLVLQPLAPAGDARPLGQINTALMSKWILPPPPPSPLRGPLHFQNGLALSLFLFDVDVRPGHNLPIHLYWQASRPLPDGMRYEISVIAPDGAVFKTVTGQPGAEWLADWPIDTPILQPTGIYFPPDAAPGRYRLRWRLWNGDSGVNGRPAWRPWFSAENDLGVIELQPWPLITTPPDDIEPIAATFAPDIRLIGYDLSRQADALSVTLVWQAETAVSANYNSFVHLLGSDGQIASQQAFIPGSGLRPTNGWRAGEVITDPYTLTLPADLPSGEYTLTAGLFDLDSGFRPAVTQNGQPQSENRATLATLTLP